VELVRRPAVGLGATGAAPDGEVEDYAFLLKGTDLGDAPDSYGTTTAAAGPNHTILPGYQLGALNDHEPDANAPLDGSGDDATGLDDEDGVAFPGGMAMVAACAATTLDVTLTDTAGVGAAFLDAWIDLPCDIFVPAARPDVIDGSNAARLKCKLILQGANIPVTARGERILHDAGIVSVPDFVANAGGVICASVEYRGGTQKQAFETIEEKIRENTRAVLELARAHSQIPAEAALALAKQRVSEAMAYRRR